MRKAKYLAEETSMKQRWRSYFHKLLNEKGEADIVLGDLAHSRKTWDFGSLSGEEMRPVRDEIPVEFWKSMDKARHRVVKRGTFNVIFKANKMR
ncbi:hypothetical protein H5410_043427 [Solanum commersonii]|uniref:Uncharacterized protein n=1 Tax=Solanum commersonii TaxID=4109 RepID=A0A9J5XXJ3_SOLCO|nr:hypothetical protein H5410_043427 [Solanum commersonii]